MIQRRPGVWRLKCYAGVDRNGDKLWRYRTIRGTPAFARRALAKFQTEVDAEYDARKAAGGRTVGELLDACLDRLGQGWTPRNLQNTRHQMHYFAPIRELPVERLTADDVAGLYADLGAGRATGRPLARATVMRAHVTLHRCLQAGVGWGWLTKNPATGQRPAAPESGDPTVPTEEQILGLLGHLDDEPDRSFALAVKVAAMTGMRRGEICGLRWTDLSFDRFQLSVNRAVVNADGPDSRWATIVREAPKTQNSRRTFTIGASFAGVLKLARLESERIAEACGAELHPQAYVTSIAADGSAPFSPHEVTRRWNRRRAAWGLPDSRFHDLRHYVATFLLNDGKSINQVAARLGDSPATILRTYGHLVPAQDAASAEALDRVLIEKLR
jgi:integrase